MKPTFQCLLLISLLLQALTSAANAQDKVDFATQIKPILEKHCMECHNEDGDQYPIELKDDALAYVVPEEPDDSDMYYYIVTEDESELMPPADFGRPLSDEQKELIRLWIEQGAEWPDEDLTFTIWKPEATEDNQSDSGDGPKDKKTDETGPEKDNQDPEGIDPRIFKAVGSLHPAILHLPMGLLLAAGLFAFLSLRGNFVMSDCAYYCLWLGVIGAIFACVSGWYIAETSHSGTVNEFNDLFNQDHKVFWHRTSALCSTLFGLLLALYAMSCRAKDPDEGLSWKLGAILLAAAIGYVGSTGGKLVYPSNHYKAIEDLFEEWTGFGEKADEPAIKKEDQPATEGDDNSEVGKTSDVI